MWFRHEEQARLHRLIARGTLKYSDATGEHDTKAQIMQCNKIAVEGAGRFYALADQAMRILQGVDSPEILSRLRQENRRLEGSLGWMMLLFEAAWEHPEGSVLWADKTIPLGALMRVKARKLGKTLTTIEVIDEIEHAVRGEIMDGDFNCELPIDPFRASVLLIDLLIEAGEPEAIVEPEQDGPEQVQWSRLTACKELRSALGIKYQNTLKGRLHEGTTTIAGKIRVRKATPTSRRFSVTIQDLPTALHERFR
jgi:hypothetical protein